MQLSDNELNKQIMASLKIVLNMWSTTWGEVEENVREVVYTAISNSINDERSTPQYVKKVIEFNITW